MADPVLSAVLSGQRAIALSWTFDSNADFQVFWKSNVPAGQEYVLLATTNAFSYTTPDLEASKTYDFYVRANIGNTYFYSNVVELFVSCGKGIVLAVSPPSPPPQIPFVDIYAAAVDIGGTVFSIYKRTAQDGLFIFQESHIARSYRGGCASPNGDVFFAVEQGALPGDIYKKTGGVGTFDAMGQTNRRWYAMAAAPNGDIYSAVYSGDIYIQAGGAGSFVGLGGTSRAWFGMTAAPNGDIYACVNSGDIYIRSGGAGSFVGLGQTVRTWRGMCAAPNGDIYCADYGGNVYIRSGGIGDFISIGFPGMDIRGMAATRDGDIYAGGDGTGTVISVRYGGYGNFIPTGDPNNRWLGIAARAF
jgi:uncharacterized Zn-binding protein involved in type VI secretion